MYRNLFHSLLLLITLVAVFLSCKKTVENEPKPLPEWEDKSADSATLTITVETQEGFYMVGSYVDLALSNDSMVNGILVRRAPTDGAGKVIFRRLYPRKYFVNCIAYNNGSTYFGNFHTPLPPGSVKDTVLFVH